MKRRNIEAGILAVVAALCPTAAFAAGKTDEAAVELVIESWRTDDLAVWEDIILPAFMDAHPGISVKFSPTPNAEYSSVLATKIEAGNAGDLIMVEPFDWRVPMYDAGDLADLTDLDSMTYFDDVAKSAWQAGDGAVFAVPLASVLHGFIYNADIFADLGLEVPETVEEFHQVLQAVKADGRYVPLAMGTADEWATSVLGYQIIGQSYWEGDKGRRGLVDRSMKFSDPPFVAVFEELARWKDYMPQGYESIGYADMQNLFTLGRAAVYPAGSWEIGIFRNLVGDAFEYAAFPPPRVSTDAGDYFCDHMDMGMALNAATENPEAAETFLNWLGSEDFASLWNESMPGFFALSSHKVAVDDPLATEFLGWRDTHRSTFRITYKTISASDVFNTDNELTRVAALVMNGKMTPQEAGDYLEEGLASWYAPHQE